MLVKTAGGEAVGRTIQNLESPSPTYYIGKGKIQELREIKETINYDTVAFDEELSPRQQSNIEEALKAKIIDRTVLILDIFAKQAHTREGKLQVELAQYQYMLPRLIGQWRHLERLGGGIGTRGPGESQLETDRRLIRRRISLLEKRIEEIRRYRTLYRQRRRNSGIPVISLVGYTNAGKSTLFNTLSKAGVSTEDKLFSTLDPVSRRITLPNKQSVLITDTVGFITKLPSSIIAAFRATLEELNEANLILHVVDITHKNAAQQCTTVDSILKELDLLSKPRITVLNKFDSIMDSEKDLQQLDSIPYLDDILVIPSRSVALISAVKGWGLNGLLKNIELHIHGGQSKTPA